MQGLAGLQLELPQQPGSSEQDSGSPFSSGTFSQPGSLDSRVLAMLIDKVLVVARTAVVMDGRGGLGEVRDPTPPATAPGQFAFMGKKYFL